MEEEMEVKDSKEMFRQHNEFIRNNDQYIEVSILIGEKDTDALVGCTIHGVGLPKVAEMILSLRQLATELEEKFPIAKLMTKFLGCESEKIVDEETTITEEEN